MAKSASRRIMTYSQRDDEERKDVESRIHETSSIIGSGGQAALSSDEASSSAGAQQAMDFAKSEEGKEVMKQLGKGEFSKAGKETLKYIKGLF